MAEQGACPAHVTFWSRGAASRNDAELRQPSAAPVAQMAFEPAGRFYAGRLSAPGAGMLVLELASPRPLRLWIDGTLALDEALFWRLFQRELRAAALVPVACGEVPFLVEVGPRPSHPKGIDDDCPSRNRAKVMAAIAERRPDRLTLAARVETGVEVPALSLRYEAAQFHRDGVTWQHVLVCQRPGFSPVPPSTDAWSPAELVEPAIALRSNVLPGEAREADWPDERRRGVRRFFVPVANRGDLPPPLRAIAPETRPEPSLEIARTLSLTVEGAKGQVVLRMPAYESLGRQAPQREYRELAWSTYEESKSRLPEPILPPAWSRYREAYDAAWRMLHNLLRRPRPESGLPGPYVGTAMKNFLIHQFVWDSSFTAMCSAYGWRTFPVYASLDLLYSRQFDGGYLHREHDVRDGLPAMYEPDFSPNPPLMATAEWRIACLTGDALRLQQVYPVLCDHHRWLEANRRLPDGTYWTTGLANGLDNSPSLGDGYPCLTAQMAQDAEVLGRIARVLGREDEAQAWDAERDTIGRALNAHLWSDSMRIYSTSLPGGGHNPNKVVTAFWPLWAGIVPPDRVEALVGHALDPKSFWRHHPLPSLAADSPHYKPDGNYWLGSTWAPTNFAAIAGFARAGRLEVARTITLRHLEVLTEVLRATGALWENFCPERSERGNWSGPDYSWTALGPIAALMEVVLGFEADALNRRLRWQPPQEGPRLGVRNYPLGPATVNAVLVAGDDRWTVEVETDRAIALELCWKGAWQTQTCLPGRTAIRLSK